MEERKELISMPKKKHDKKIINIIRKIIDILTNTRFLVLLIGIILVCKATFFHQSTVFVNEKVWAYTIRQTVLFVIILVFPMLLCTKPKTRFILGMIINTIISIILFADNLYYLYATNLISVGQAGNIVYINEILQEIPYLLDIKQIFYFIDIILILILYFLKIIKIKKEKKKGILPIIITGIIIILSCTIYKLLPESLNSIAEFMCDKTYSVKLGTIFGYHVVDAFNYIGNKDNTKYKDYENMIFAYNQLQEEKNKEIIENNEYDGIAKGKNVIVIQLESVQQFVVGKTINGKEITPNLNKFLNENIQFTNMHASSYTTTADSEHSFITSTYPTENGEAFSRYYANTYDDIFYNYKKAGYKNIYVHGNNSYFWNREGVLSNIEIDEKIFIDDFKDTSEKINGFLSDELVYTQMVEKIEQYEQEEETYFIDIISASSHTPFKLEGIENKEEKVSIDVGKYKDTAFGNYLEAINYMDYAFGIFIDKLKEIGVYDNTVILIYGDHYGVKMYDEDFIDFLGEDEENFNTIRLQYEFSNVICGIHIPGANCEKIEYPVSKIDIKQTLLQISGIEEEFSLGINMLDYRPYISINNGRIITEEYLYNGAWYNIETGKEVDLESLSEEERNVLEKYVYQMKEELDISNSIVFNNLLNKEK